jgi:Ni,Fe-hydrogenase III small subunit
MAVCQNLVPLVNIKIAGKWMFIPLKMVLIGIDPYPYHVIFTIMTVIVKVTMKIHHRNPHVL